MKHRDGVSLRARGSGPQAGRALEFLLVLPKLNLVFACVFFFADHAWHRKSAPADDHATKHEGQLGGLVNNAVSEREDAKPCAFDVDRVACRLLFDLNNFQTRGYYFVSGQNIRDLSGHP